MALAGAVAHEVEREPARAVRLALPGDGRWERRFWVALGFAAILHSGFALFVRRQAPEPAAHRAPPQYLEVSLIETPPPIADESPTVPPAGGQSSAPERVAALERVAPASRSDVVAEPAPLADGVETAPEATTEPPSVDSAAPSSPVPPGGFSLDALGIGNRNPFFGMKGIGDAPAQPAPRPAVSGEAPDRTRMAEQRLKQYLIVGMLAHDRATGQSRNGAVITALRDAAMLITSPVNGQAEFVATIDATGLVTALRPTRVSSNAADWRNVAARALRELAKKRLRVPAGAAGLEVRLALSSKIQLPSGSTSMATVHMVPLMNADGTRLSRLEQSPESNKLPDQGDPGSLGTPLMKQPIPGSGLDGDLADIGGVGHRIVRVTITDERPL